MNEEGLIKNEGKKKEMKGCIEKVQRQEAKKELD